jgi:hypothetical protein
MSLPSSAPMYTRLPYTATPRLTGPQQWTVGPSYWWTYSHFFLPVAASSPTTWLSGVEMYITPFTTTGLVSKAWGMPVSYFQARFSRPALAGVIWRSGE